MQRGKASLSKRAKAILGRWYTEEGKSESKKGGTKKRRVAVRKKTDPEVSKGCPGKMLKIGKRKKGKQVY